MKKLKYFEKALICREALGLSQSQLCKIINVLQPVYSRFESGQVKTPAYIDRLLNLFKTNKGWIYDDIGPPPEYWPYSNNQKKITSWDDLYQIDIKCCENRFSLPVKDHAMEDHLNPARSFFENQRIEVDPKMSPRNGVFVIAKLKNNKIVLRKYIEEEQKLIAFNKNYEPISFDEIAEIYGVVTQRFEKFVEN